uniref:Uncharacterized protein n=1 Tax=Timema genevievae TaxID=629358 RepID=A0A7R9JQB7_TIMGE|nr:unnamed protein product [Timema genevievae]
MKSVSSRLGKSPSCFSTIELPLINSHHYFFARSQMNKHLVIAWLFTVAEWSKTSLSCYTGLLKTARPVLKSQSALLRDFLTTQMLAQSVGEGPVRRETRTMEANKHRDTILGTPGSSSHEEGIDFPHHFKRKRLYTSSETPDRGAKRRKFTLNSPTQPQTTNNSPRNRDAVLVKFTNLPPHSTADSHKWNTQRNAIDSSTENLIYQLQYNYYIAEYIGLTTGILRQQMNPGTILIPTTMILTNQ